MDDVVIAHRRSRSACSSSPPRSPGRCCRSTTPTSAGPTASAIGAALVAMVLALVQSFKRKRLARADPRRTPPSRASSSASSPASSTTASPTARPCRPCSAPWRSSPAVLVAYKAGWIRVNRRFYGFVMAAALGFILLMAVNLLFAVFGGGDGLGFRSGPLGIIFGVVGDPARRAASSPWTSSRSRTASPTARRARRPGWPPSA